MQEREYVCNLHKTEACICAFWAKHQIQKTLQKGIDKKGVKVVEY